MQYTTDQLVKEVRTVDPRITVLPSTWQYEETEKSLFTFQTVRGDIALNLNDVPHTMHFELSLVILPNEDAEVLLSYQHRIYTTDLDSPDTGHCGEYSDPMSPWSARTLADCVAWRVNDSIMYQLSIADEDESVMP
jgi:hypothetical protein